MKTEKVTMHYLLKFYKYKLFSIRNKLSIYSSSETIIKGGMNNKNKKKCTISFTIRMKNSWHAVYNGELK